MRDVVLALLVKAPSHGYALRSRLQDALGPLGDTLNAGQIYVTLGRLEKAGLIEADEHNPADRPERKVYRLTSAGHARVDAWLTEVAWPRPAPTEFHLKLIAAQAAGADPVRIADAQRRELLRLLRDAQRAALLERSGSTASLLLEGAVLRLSADLRWLDAAAAHWLARRGMN